MWCNGWCHCLAGACVSAGSEAVVPKKYSDQFRADVVRFALDRPVGMTLAQVAADFGVSLSGLQRWIQRDRVAVGQRTPGVRDERERIAQLEKALRLKEEECEILRRAAAYLARDVNPK